MTPHRDTSTVLSGLQQKHDMSFAWMFVVPTFVDHGADTAKCARVRLSLNVRNACDQEVFNLGQPQAKIM